MRRSTLTLTIELVPATAWYRNLRSLLGAQEWDDLRRAIYRKAGYRCEICGDKPGLVHAHELWEYDDKKHTQTLKGLSCLCPACHEVKHFGLARIEGRAETALSHLAKVNGISLRMAKALVRRAFEQYRKRSRHEWASDTSWVRQERK